LGHWVPLVVTLTVATIGVAAWAWSQRDHEDEELETPPPGLDYENADYGDNPAYGASDSRRDTHPGNPSNSRAESATYGVEDVRQEANANAGWGSQVSGALRQTSSPQQFLSSAGKTVVAGVGAVGAAMGSALAAIREEDKTAYADHETWSEEAEAQKERPPQARESNRRRKTVVIVVSADTDMDVLDDDTYHEHAVCFRLWGWRISLLTLPYSLSCPTFLVIPTSPRSSCSY
jgi:hypothetical protein